MFGFLRSLNRKVTTKNKEEESKQKDEKVTTCKPKTDTDAKFSGNKPDLIRSTEDPHELSSKHAQDSRKTTTNQQHAKSKPTETPTHESNKHSSLVPNKTTASKTVETLALDAKKHSSAVSKKSVSAETMGHEATKPSSSVSRKTSATDTPQCKPNKSSLAVHKETAPIESTKGSKCESDKSCLSALKQSTTKLDKLSSVVVEPNREKLREPDSISSNNIMETTHCETTESYDGIHNTPSHSLHGRYSEKQTKSLESLAMSYSLEHDKPVFSKDNRSPEPATKEPKDTKRNITYDSSDTESEPTPVSHELTISINKPKTMEKHLAVKLKAKQNGKDQMQILEQMTEVEDLSQKIQPTSSNHKVTRRQRSKRQKNQRPKSLPSKQEIKGQNSEESLDIYENRPLSEWCQTDIILYDTTGCQTESNIHIEKQNQTSKSSATALTQTPIKTFTNKQSQSSQIQSDSQCCQTKLIYTSDTAISAIPKTTEAAVNTVQETVTKDKHRRELLSQESRFQDEINNLNANIREKADRLDEQTKKIESLRQQKQEVVRQELLYQQQLRQVRAELKNTETQLQQETRDAEAYKTEKEEMAKKMEDITNQLTHKTTELHDVKLKVEALQTELTECRSNMSKLQQQLSAKTDEVSSMTSTLLGTDRQRLKLEDDLKVIQEKLKDIETEKDKLIKEKNNSYSEQEEDLSILHEALEEAIHEKEELESKFEKLRTVNSCREQQLLDDFEWKLRELEQNHKKKMKEQESVYEDKLKTVQDCVKADLQKEITEVENKKKLADEQLQKWEVRLEAERTRLASIHAQDKQIAIQKLTEEKQKLIDSIEETWKKKEQSLLEKISTLAEQERTLQEELTIHRSHSGDDVFSLKMQLDQVKKAHEEELDQLQQNQYQQTKKLKDEQAGASGSHSEYTLTLDKLRSSLQQEQRDLLEYMRELHDAEMRAVNSQLSQALKHSTNLKTQLQNEKESAENKVKEKEEQLKCMQSKLCDNNSSKVPDDNTESGFVNHNWDESSDDDNESFLFQDADVDEKAESVQTSTSSPDSFHDTIQTSDENIKV